MKLARFAKISGYRIFRDFAWPNGLEDFSRFNLVYGWNGSGKTTLSILFRSLQMATPIADGDVEFIFDDAKVSGRNLNEAELPAVRVFNRDTAARSVFEASGGTLGQFPPVYVFGEESAEKQRQLNELKPKQESLAEAVKKASADEARAQKELNEYAATTARAIKNLLVAPGGNFNNYNAADFRAEIARISQDTKQLLSAEERQLLLDRKDAQPREFIRVSNVQFPDLTALRNEAREALKKSVVSNVIDELAANSDLSAWVRHGLTLHSQPNDSKTCKFCEQPLPASRLRRLEAHFNDEFRRFTQELQQLNASNTVRRRVGSSVRISDERDRPFRDRDRGFRQRDRSFRERDRADRTAGLALR
ncbi:AAA family ATPase, partial [Paraburkholderia sp. EG304]|uniref:AAA family ATPase n=1 Tax=Paraburkholderia sp. EG304 TaxID=3237015 RepID=UPI0039796E86